MLGAHWGRTGKYKTEKMDKRDAFRMIMMNVHPQPHVVQRASQQQLGVGGGHFMTEEIPRPTLAWLEESQRTNIFTLTDCGLDNR